MVTSVMSQHTDQSITPPLSRDFVQSPPLHCHSQTLLTCRTGIRAKGFLKSLRCMLRDQAASDSACDAEINSYRSPLPTRLTVLAPKTASYSGKIHSCMVKKVAATSESESTADQLILLVQITTRFPQLDNCAERNRRPDNRHSTSNHGK